MHGAETLRLGVVVMLSLLLVWAAASDVRDRRIPNFCVLLVIALFLPWVIAGGPLVSGLGAAAIGFAVGYPMFLFRVMGAGDVKLFAVAALFVGLGHLPLFALVTVMTGGVMALASLASRPRRALAMMELRGKGDFGRGIPYGVAIAIGAAVVAWGMVLNRLPMEIAGLRL